MVVQNIRRCHPQIMSWSPCWHGNWNDLPWLGQANSTPGSWGKASCIGNMYSFCSACCWWWIPRLNMITDWSGIFLDSCDLTLKLGATVWARFRRWPPNPPSRCNHGHHIRKKSTGIATDWHSCKKAPRATQFEGMNWCNIWTFMKISNLTATKKKTRKVTKSGNTNVWISLLQLCWICE